MDMEMIRTALVSADLVPLLNAAEPDEVYEGSLDIPGMGGSLTGAFYRFGTAIWTTTRSTVLGSEGTTVSVHDHPTVEVALLCLREAIAGSFNSVNDSRARLLGIGDPVVTHRVRGGEPEPVSATIGSVFEDTVIPDAVTLGWDTV